MFNNVRFNWLRDKDNNPVAVIASAQLVDEKIMKQMSIHYALAIHNPADKFDKQLARKIAEGRMRFQGKYDGLVGLVDPTVPNVKLAILANIASSKDLPKRVREAAEFRVATYKPGPRVNA